MNSKIALFYHIFAPDSAAATLLIVDEQVKRIQASGLANNADIFCCIAGPSHLKLKEFVELYNWIKIIDTSEDLSEFEGFTLKHLFHAAGGGGLPLFRLHPHQGRLAYTA